HDDAGADAIDLGNVGGERRLIIGGPTRHALLDEIVVALARKLAARHHFSLGGIRIVGVWAVADAKAQKRIGGGEKHRFALEDVRILRPAGAATLDRVGVVDAPALAQEIVQPAFATVGCGLPGYASEPAAMPHQERIDAVFVAGQEILHIHLLDLVGAVRIDPRRHAT